MSRIKKFNKLYSTSLPNRFYSRVTRGLNKLSAKEQIPALFLNIHKEFSPGRQYVATTTNTYLSRCLPVSEIIRRRLRTCGSIVAVAVACLRRMGIEVRMVDGRIFHQGRWRTHAWLEIRQPVSQRWISYDPMWNGFKLRSRHRRRRTCNDWSEIESTLREEAEKGRKKKSR